MSRCPLILVTAALAAALAVGSVAAQSARAPGPAAPPTQDYLLYAVAESADQLALVRFGPRGIRVEREHKVGMMPTEINGPHGGAVSPDSRYAFVTEEGRGSEPGILEVFDLRSLTRVAKVELGQQAAGVDFFRIEAVK